MVNSQLQNNIKDDERGGFTDLWAHMKPQRPTVSLYSAWLMAPKPRLTRGRTWGFIYTKAKWCIPPELNASFFLGCNYQKQLKMYALDHQQVWGIMRVVSETPCSRRYPICQPPPGLHCRGALLEGCFRTSGWLVFSFVLTDWFCCRSVGWLITPSFVH